MMHSGLGTNLRVFSSCDLWQTLDLPPGGARGVLPATEACFRGELMFVLPFPLAFPFGAAGDDWKKSGDEDGIICRAA